MSAGHVRQIDTPDEIYRRPQDAFVASFVGDVNIVPGRYAGRDGAAVLELGGNVLRLPADRVHADIGERLDVYMRPENIQLAPLGPRSLFSATVITHVFGAIMWMCILMYPRSATPRCLRASRDSIRCRAGRWAALSG